MWHNSDTNLFDLIPVWLFMYVRLSVTMHACVCLSVYPNIHPAFYVSTYPFSYPSINVPSLYPSKILSFIRLSISLSIYTQADAHTSINIYICVHLRVCLSLLDWTCVCERVYVCMCVWWFMQYSILSYRCVCQTVGLLTYVYLKALSIYFS